MFRIGKKGAKKNRRTDAGLIDVDERGVLVMPEGKAWISQEGLRGIEGALRHVIIPEGVTEIGAHSFAECIKLESAAIPGSVGEIGNAAFRGRPYLKSVKMSKGTVRIGGFAFDNCTALERVELPEGLTAIGERAFCNCRALRSITLPEGLTEIGAKAFEHCSLLEEVTFPASLRTIGEEAFRDCTYLKRVHAVQPEGLAQVGKDAFAGCGKLKEVNIPGVAVPSHREEKAEPQPRGTVFEPPQGASDGKAPAWLSFSHGGVVRRADGNPDANVLVYRGYMPQGRRDPVPPWAQYGSDPIGTGRLIPEAARRYILHAELRTMREMVYLDNPAEARFTSYGFEEFITGYELEVHIRREDLMEAMRAGIIHGS